MGGTSDGGDSSFNFPEKEVEALTKRLEKFRKRSESANGTWQQGIRMHGRDEAN